MINFGLGTLFYVGLLLVNALAVLNKERFLLRGGWGLAFCFSIDACISWHALEYHWAS